MPKIYIKIHQQAVNLSPKIKLTVLNRFKNSNGIGHWGILFFSEHWNSVLDFCGRLINKYSIRGRGFLGHIWDKSYQNKCVRRMDSGGFVWNLMQSMGWIQNAFFLYCFKRASYFYCDFMRISYTKFYRRELLLICSELLCLH